MNLNPVLTTAPTSAFSTISMPDKERLSPSSFKTPCSTTPKPTTTTDTSVVDVRILVGGGGRNAAAAASPPISSSSPVPPQTCEFLPTPSPTRSQPPTSAAAPAYRKTICILRDNGPSTWSAEPRPTVASLQSLHAEFVNDCHRPNHGAADEIRRCPLAPPDCLARLETADCLYFVCKRRLMVGRETTHSRPDVNFDETLVSRAHLEVELKEDDNNNGQPSWRLKCNGKNGILVNNTHFSKGQAEAILPSDCVLRFPSTEIQMHFSTNVYHCHQSNMTGSSSSSTGSLSQVSPVTPLLSSSTGHPDQDVSTATVGVGQNGSTLNNNNCSSILSPCSSGVSAFNNSSSIHPEDPSWSSGRQHDDDLRFKPADDLDSSMEKLNRTPSLDNDFEQQDPDESLDNSDCDAFCDDKEGKPPYSYAQLIVQAISSTEDRQMTLAGIYSYITKHYAYYRTSEKGWQNSIRHNLSLCRHFVRMPRSQDEPGKGSFWRIDPASETKQIQQAYKKRRQGKNSISSSSGCSLSYFPSSSSSSLTANNTAATFAADSVVGGYCPGGGDGYYGSAEGTSAFECSSSKTSSPVAWTVNDLGLGRVKYEARLSSSPTCEDNNNNPTRIIIGPSILTPSVVSDLSPSARLSTLSANSGDVFFNSSGGPCGSGSADTFRCGVAQPGTLAPAPNEESSRPTGNDNSLNKAVVVEQHCTVNLPSPDQKPDDDDNACRSSGPSLTNASSSLDQNAANNAAASLVVQVQSSTTNRTSSLKLPTVPDGRPANSPSSSSSAAASVHFRDERNVTHEYQPVECCSDASRGRDEKLNLLGLNEQQQHQQQHSMTVCVGPTVADLNAGKSGGAGNANNSNNRFISKSAPSSPKSYSKKSTSAHLLTEPRFGRVHHYSGGGGGTFVVRRNASDGRQRLQICHSPPSFVAVDSSDTSALKALTRDSRGRRDSGQQLVVRGGAIYGAGGGSSSTGAAAAGSTLSNLNRGGSKSLCTTPVRELLAGHSSKNDSLALKHTMVQQPCSSSPLNANTIHSNNNSSNLFSSTHHHNASSGLGKRAIDQSLKQKAARFAAAAAAAANQQPHHRHSVDGGRIAACFNPMAGTAQTATMNGLGGGGAVNHGTNNSGASAMGSTGLAFATVGQATNKFHQQALHNQHRSAPASPLNFLSFLPPGSPRQQAALATAAAVLASGLQPTSSSLLAAAGSTAAGGNPYAAAVSNVGAGQHPLRRSPAACTSPAMSSLMSSMPPSNGAAAVNLAALLQLQQQQQFINNNSSNSNANSFGCNNSTTAGLNNFLAAAAVAPNVAAALMMAAATNQAAMMLPNFGYDVSTAPFLAAAGLLPNAGGGVGGTSSSAAASPFYAAALTNNLLSNLAAVASSSTPPAQNNGDGGGGGLMDHDGNSPSSVAAAAAALLVAHQQRAAAAMAIGNSLTLPTAPSPPTTTAGDPASSMTFNGGPPLPKISRR